MSDISRRSLVAGAAVLGSGLVTAAGGEAAPVRLPSQAATLAAFRGRRATYWGMHAPGTISGFSTATRQGRGSVCLTFDACGGHVTRFDSELIAVLRRYRVPATLFINSTWAKNNAATTRNLLADPLFQIENHGTSHAPLSTTGRSAYGIAGSRSLAEVWTEIATCHTTFASSFGHLTRFMRPGTAYADDVAAAAARYMGQPIVSFSANIDAGASLPAAAVTAEMMKLRPGAIAIGHFNRPGSGTAAGVAKALPVLKARGMSFRRLSDVI